MANVAHSGLTAANLHEPKGVAAATVDKVYVSNGAGSGAWQKIEIDQIDTASIFDTNEGVVTGFITDTSSGTATANRVYIVLPYACTVNKIWTVMLGAIATADNTLTCSNHAGSSMGTITQAFSGSAAGDVDSLTPSSNNTFTAGERILIASDGAGTNTVPTMVSVAYTVTA